MSIHRVRGKMFYGESTYDAELRDYEPASEYDALEARCREQSELLERMRKDSPSQSLFYYWHDICALTASETKAEPEFKGDAPWGVRS